MQNDVGWNGIVVSDGKIVEEEVEIGGDGGWNVTVLGLMEEEDVECGEVDALETFPPRRPSCFRMFSKVVFIYCNISAGLNGVSVGLGADT
jgi:hypothetical protein